MSTRQDILDTLHSTASGSTKDVFHLLTTKNGRLEAPKYTFPCLIAVLGGQMRLCGPFGNETVESGQYTTTDFDTPLVIDATAGSAQEFAALQVPLPASEIIETVIALEQTLIEAILAQRFDNAHLQEQDAAVFDVLLRLVRSVNKERFAAHLVKTLRAELIFHLLCGRRGKDLVMAASRGTGESGIMDANNWIKANFRASFSVEELARAHAMSVSNFHQKFKQTIGMGPIQCQKALRLAEARRLMLDESHTVTQAAFAVGYESLSQFIRDYRHKYGHSPREDLARVRSLLKN